MRVVLTRSIFIPALIAFLTLPALAAAQTETTPPPQSQPAAAVAVQSGPDPDLGVVVEEPDFTLAALPTTLRMPKGKFSFRLTHRFNRPIAQGTVGDFFADLFGFDSSAKIGLEVRYGVMPGLQAAVHRTNDRAIQMSGQYDVMKFEPGRHFISLAAVGAVEGQNNFSENFGGTIGGIVSLPFSGWGAVYAEPLVVMNANIDELDTEGDQHTFMIGLGGRLRLGRNSRTYFVAEVTPRLAGYRPGVEQASFAIEKRAGGHVFQFNVSNSLGTTFRQIAQSGPRNDWYVGFNLTRKFW